MFNNFFFFAETRAVYEIIRKKKYIGAREATDDNIMQRMCCVT
jgi:hypothetical protein